MRILGIDPGTAITGYGLLDKKPGKLVHVAHGVIRTPAKMPLPERYCMLYNELNLLLHEYQPEVLVTERLFFSSNVNTGIAVGGSIGVVLLSAAQRGIAWHEYRPAEVKLAVVGYGAAEKQQVQYMVTRLLNLVEAPKPDDAADGLAIAICHANSISPGQK